MHFIIEYLLPVQGSSCLQPSWCLHVTFCKTNLDSNFLPKGQHRADKSVWYSEFQNCSWTAVALLPHTLKGQHPYWAHLRITEKFCPNGLPNSINNTNTQPQCNSAKIMQKKHLYVKVLCSLITWKITAASSGWYTQFTPSWLEQF